MRYRASEKREIFVLVGRSSVSVRRTLDHLGIIKLTFHGWCERYRQGGHDALPNCSRGWKRLLERVRQSTVNLAVERLEWSARELALLYSERHGGFVSESNVYRLLKAQYVITTPTFVLMKAVDALQHPVTAPDQLWQSDFTNDKVLSWRRFYLFTVLHDYSRYILAWQLCDGMAAKDLADTLSLLSLALETSGLDNATGRPYHAITQGKIKCCHRTVKSQVLLKNRYLLGNLKTRLGEFDDYCNSERYHESLNYVMHEGVDTGRGQIELNRRQRIKQIPPAERSRLFDKQKAA